MNNINISNNVLTFELDKELEKLTDAILVQAKANLKTAEALLTLAQKTLMAPQAPMIQIGEIK